MNRAIVFFLGFLAGMIVPAIVLVLLLSTGEGEVRRERLERERREDLQREREQERALEELDEEKLSMPDRLDREARRLARYLGATAAQTEQVRQIYSRLDREHQLDPMRIAWDVEANLRWQVSLFLSPEQRIFIRKHPGLFPGVNPDVYPD
jgi:hypothetical protein